jgi:hypothetical protein
MSAFVSTKGFVGILDTFALHEFAEALRFSLHKNAKHSKMRKLLMPAEE